MNPNWWLVTFFAAWTCLAILMYVAGWTARRQSAIRRMSISAVPVPAVAVPLIAVSDAGYAVVLVHHPSTGETRIYPFHGTDHPDPLTVAHDFCAQENGGYPDWLWTVAGNPEAIRIRAERYPTRRAEY